MTLDAPKSHDVLQNNDQRLAEFKARSLCQISQCVAIKFSLYFNHLLQIYLDIQIGI